MPADQWKIDDVAEWAAVNVKLQEKYWRTLQKEEVDGKTLLKLTEEKLQKSGFTLGAAAALAEAIEKLKEVIVTLDTVDELLSGMKLHTRESFSFYDELNQPHAVDFL